MDEDWEPPSKHGSCNEADVPVRRSGRKRKQVDYVNEKQDAEFAGVKGYTHFGRTRKGGDVRPRRKAERKPSAAITSRVTMLNFFARPGRTVVPMTPSPRADKASKNKKASTARKPTRTLWGRPKKHEKRDAKIRAMQKNVERKLSEGTASMPPTKRMEQSGSMKAKVARLTKAFLQESCGNEKTAAQLLSNFEAQRAVAPFVYRGPTDLSKAGANVRDTVLATKQSSRKVGTPVDIMRRHLIAGSATGQLASAHEVGLTRNWTVGICTYFCVIFFVHNLLM